MPPIPPALPLPRQAPNFARIPARSRRFSASALLLLGFCPSALALPSATPTWSVEGNERSGYLAVVAGVGDLNADGYEDAAIGGYGRNSGAGEVLIYAGGPAGLSPTTSASLVGEYASVGQFGLSLGGPGDIDGDGYDDVLVGGSRSADGWNSEQAVWLFGGGAAGLNTASTWSAGCGYATGYPSGLAAAAGDVNGDGLGDILLVCNGYAFEYDGDASGEPVLGWTASGTNDGWTGSGVGDLDGDGLDDFAFGNGSEVSVYAGAADAPGRGPSWILSMGATTTSLAGAGDVDADGYDDLLAAYSGAAVLLSGGATTLDVAWQVTGSGSTSISRAGSVGDVDGDGFSDVYLGLSSWDAPAQDAGKIEIFLGSPAGLTVSAQWSTTGSQRSEYFGAYAAGLDADGDGYDDLLVGGSGWANPETSEGGAWLYPGAPDPDADGDGDPDWRDCDDTDATVYSGAPYVCDGRDHDCDGVVDDGQDWYTDADGDGFGDDATAVHACTAPAATVGVGGDCDDTDAAVFPGASDAWYDGVDGNCDGNDDDQDGDGWSDEGHGGWDCDDTDPLVLPWDCDPADDLIVDGVTVELAGPHTYRAVWVVNGGVISVIPDDGFGYTGWLDLTAYIIFVGGHGSSIDADGAATASAGPGTPLDSWNPGDGAGYGGRGGSSYSDGAAYGIGGSTYGTRNGTDLALGSSGGDCYSSYDGSLVAAGAPGGGAIGLTADLLRIDGTISASGADGGVEQNGGGSGGTINLRAAELQMVGSLRAGGGDGQGEGGYGTAAGGGGGGRVRIRSCTIGATFDIDTYGGSGGYSGSSGTTFAGVDSVLDLDGDGVSACVDTDDADACGRPLSDWYVDADGDGLGSATSVTLCTQPSGFVAIPGDCDDTDSAIGVGSPSSIWYADADGDGLGSSISTTGCSPPAGYVANTDDCDDTDPRIGDVPLATWYADADGDSLGSYAVSTVACVQPTGYLSTPGDCDDTDAATGGPGHTYRDRDLDGYGAGALYDFSGCESPGFAMNQLDCDDHNSALSPGVAEVCNGLDDNCDGTVDTDGIYPATWYLDADGDGYGSGIAFTATACSPPAGYSFDNGDCNETDASIRPNAADPDADGIDQDCSDPYNASILVAEGAAWTPGGSVNVALLATDNGGVIDMCLSATPSCTTWQIYTTSTRTYIGTAAGAATVYAWFRDADGNVSIPVSDGISIDNTAPTDGTVSGIAGDTTVALTWSGFSDATSGIVSYSVRRSGTSTPPASCSAGAVVYSGAATSATITGLTSGTTYGFRVCATDAAGNTSAGARRSVRVGSAPTGTVSINSGATWTRSPGVTLTLAATDDTAVTEMCLSNTTTCTVFSAYTTTQAWTLGGAGTTRTVYATFKDAAGNQSTRASDTIQLDRAAPTTGTLTATSGLPRRASLSWSGFTDTLSGIASYTVVRSAANGVTPASCGAGTVVYTGAGTSSGLAALTSGSTYGFRVCATDVAGNVDAGASASVLVQ